MKTPPRVWLVTGASRGLGAAIVKGILDAGDSVVATMRKVPAGGDACGGRLLTLPMDVTDASSATAAVDQAMQHFGRIDVLVNNAGFGLFGAIEEASESDVRRVFDTNVFGALNVIRAVLPGMRARRSGHILNISSAGGFFAFPGWGTYCATKFAVEAVTEALQQELSALGIRATIVAPGGFRTDFYDKSSASLAHSTIDEYAEVLRPTRRLMEEENHKQRGDPAKFAAALIEIVNAENPPLRLALGEDSLGSAEVKLEKMRRDLVEWRTLSLSTDAGE